MHTIAIALSLLAAVAVVCAGFAWILGLIPIRDRLLHFVLIVVALLLLLPACAQLLESLAARLSEHMHIGGGTLALAAMGHVALAVLLVRRRFRGDAARRRAEEMSRARTRSRARLLPDGEERGE